MSNKAKNESGKAWVPWVITVLSVAVVVLVIVVIVLLQRPERVISNFEQCRAAGGAILESDPEQCLINGNTFTNRDDDDHKEQDSYIGLTEAEALAKAKENNIRARVIEREGESIMHTMDLVFGRHNFFIKDGKVYKVEVEGSDLD